MTTAAEEKALALGGKEGELDRGERKPMQGSEIVNEDDELNEDLGEGEGEGEGEGDDQFTDDEIRASERGWRPKAEWQGDPDEWRPAKIFNEIGDLQSQVGNQNKQIKGMKKSYTEDISNLNAVHKRQMENQSKQLKSDLKKAIRAGDDDLVDEIEKEQEELEQQKQSISQSTNVGSPQADAILQGEWEGENDYIFDQTDPRHKAAMSAFHLATAKGFTMEDKLAFVDERVAKVAAKMVDETGGNVNQNRNKPSGLSGGGGGAGGKGGGKGKILTMADLSGSEKNLRDVFPDTDAGEKAFLKSITNARKGG